MTLVETIPPSHDDAAWRDAVAAIRSDCPREHRARWEGIFGPLRAGLVDDLLVVGQIGQSLDGRAATATGHSHYINGTEGLDHLHRLRALVDAVVVGVGTALADDPLLTVRRVAGPHPGARHHRSAGTAAGERAGCATTASAASSFAPTARGRRAAGPDRAHCASGRSTATSNPPPFSPPRRARPAAHPDRGRSGTVARFLEARCLDRLHVVVAPIILGGGRSSLDLAPIARCEEAMRPPPHPCARQRGAVRLRPFGSAPHHRAAKKST